MERKPRTRSDSLPETTRYRDDGCDISESCFTCPLPRCRYEEPGGLRALLNEARDREILDLRNRGVSVEALATRFGVSRRTVFRVLGAKPTSRPRREEEDFAPIPIRSTEPRREAQCA
ncbi:MAG: helix-turn-helix domain-containing protein [Dehalococcoidia bacterium]